MLRRGVQTFWRSCVAATTAKISHIGHGSALKQPEMRCDAELKLYKERTTVKCFVQVFVDVEGKNCTVLISVQTDK